jgi:hypothetical protein
LSPGISTFSTTKTGRHDLAENGVKHQKSINHNLPLVEDGQDLVEVVAIVVW